MKHFIWLGTLFAALCFSACSTAPDLAEQPDQDAPAAPAAPQVEDQEAPTAAPQPADESGSETSGEAVGEFGGLRSYRLYARESDQESGDVIEYTAEGVLEPFALHTIQTNGESIEMITMNETLWLKMPGIGWYKSDFTSEELAMTPEEWLAYEETGELPDIPPWPSAIVFLPGQFPLPLVEGGLTPAGSETINGISCLKYAVLTDYSYEFEQIAFDDTGTTSVQAAGTVWVADQADLPPIIIQADIDKTETTTFAGVETVSTTRIEHQVMATNVPVVIEPPADVVELDDVFFDQDDFESGDQPDDLGRGADLSELLSYRLVTSITVQMGEIEMTTTQTAEWVRDQEAYRYTQTDGMTGMNIGFLWIGDSAWMLAGDEWIEVQSDEDPDPLESLSGLAELDDDMNLVGEEVVNGVRCLRYASDEMVYLNSVAQYEACVADEAGHPPLIIHSWMRMVQEEQVTITEQNLYDVNQPITIEPPG